MSVTYPTIAELGEFGNLMDMLSPGAAAAGWTTDPTNTANIYDQNLSTATGMAEDTNNPAAETNGDCEIKIDLGAKYLVTKIYAKIGIAGDTHATICRMRAGDTGDLTDTQYGLDGAAKGGAGEEVNYFFQTVADVNAGVTDVEPVRYITFRCFDSNGVGGETSQLKIYEVVVLGYSGMTF